MDYKSFIENKKITDIPTGHVVDIVSDMLFDFQKDIVKWAIRRRKTS